MAGVQTVVLQQVVYCGVGEVLRVGRLRDVELAQVRAEEAQVAVEHDGVREPAARAVQPRELPRHEVAQRRARADQRKQRVDVVAQARQHEVARELRLDRVDEGKPPRGRQAQRVRQAERGCRGRLAALAGQRGDSTLELVVPVLLFQERKANCPGWEAAVEGRPERRWG